MLSVHDWASLSRALRTPIDLRLKRLLIERRDQLGIDQDLSTIARFVIVHARRRLCAFQAKWLAVGQSDRLTIRRARLTIHKAKMTRYAAPEISEAIK